MDLLYYLGAALTAALYAMTLEKIGKDRYEPDFTVVTVALGVALTGGWVALRLAANPNLTAWETWWLWFWMFIATGTPITGWQIWQARSRVRGLLRYLGITYDNPTQPTTTLASERREPAQSDD